MALGSASDILGVIVWFNQTNALYNFALASREFAGVACPTLYNTISIHSDHAPALFWTLANRESFGKWVSCR
jgi:hypothetical protein